jgi:hypothetical protein
MRMRDVAQSAGIIYLGKRLVRFPCEASNLRFSLEPPDLKGETKHAKRNCEMVLMRRRVMGLLRRTAAEARTFLSHLGR